MKNVLLKQLDIKEFKGVKSASYVFNQETWISGANGTGKTTIVDAFLWCLFGKNTDDKKDFSIKPLDSLNKTTDKVDNEVQVTLEVSGEKVVLKRVNHESWVKSRGELEPKFTGNETLYFWNDVPQKAKEFSDKVNELIEEGLFKMITSPFFFASLPWQDRRRIVISIVGEVSDKDIAYTRKEFSELIDRLAGKSFDDFKKELAFQKKGYKQELDQIPARIDELVKSTPERPDESLIQVDMNNLELLIKQCDNRIKDKSAASEQFFADKTKRNERIYQIRTEIAGMAEAEKTKIRAKYSDAVSRRSTLSFEIKNIEAEISNNQKAITTFNQTIAQIDKFLETKRGEWKQINDSELKFDDNDFMCPTCKRSFDLSDIEAKQAEMTANFNRNKSERLTAINQEGKTKKDSKDEISGKIKELEEQIKFQTEILEGKKQELASIGETPSEFDINIQAQKAVIELREYVELNDELTRLNEVNNIPFSESGNVTAIEAERKEHYGKLDSLKLRLKDLEVISRNNARVNELTERSKQLGQLIADLEKQEFTMAEFEKAKVDIIEDKVNELFTRVQFKMFRQQINGGLEPCCDILIAGVPFTDANTASKINAGIEIINILCKHYEVTAPIFLDNRESCTEIIPTESQIINLVVSPEHKTLTFN